MKTLLSVVTAIAVFAMSTGLVMAAPFKAADKNPNIVAHYEDGPHTIIGIDGSDEEVSLEGKDIVMKAGKSGNFQQWFENDKNYHSVWRHVGEATECPEGWVLVENAKNPDDGDTWGDYLEEGNYCVRTNEYKKGGK
jgi:uncharacterized protein YbdZ (MbtH family)